MKFLLKIIVSTIATLLFIIIFLLLLPFIFIFKNNRTNKPRLVWGVTPIINNHYWSNALIQDRYFSKTLMTHHYLINDKSNFDLYTDDFIPSFIKKTPLVLIYNHLVNYIIFIYSLFTFDIFHITAHGYVLQFTLLKRLEAQILKIAGKKTIVIPYGADFWQYSKVHDLSLRHALLLSYPKAAIEESKISKSLNYWIKNADIFFPSLQTDGCGRWDVLIYNALIIDSNKWKPKINYSNADGIHQEVVISHTPNHRGFKGTEFIILAIEQLKKEGLKIKFNLIERKTNTEVKEILLESDILVEQLIVTGYAMSAVEGMACGLPVISNLEDRNYTEVFRRYSYLNEAPIISSSPETIVDRLRTLITNPAQRTMIGKSGRKYIEKYHSYRTGQFLFNNIYDKIWFNKEVDLMKIFEPLNPSSYNNLNQSNETNEESKNN